MASESGYAGFTLLEQLLEKAAPKLLRGF